MGPVSYTHLLGEDNLIPHEVDMVADNGDDRYGTVTDRVFILSCDEYRKYRKHVPLRRGGKLMWKVVYLRSTMKRLTLTF